MKKIIFLISFLVNLTVNAQEPSVLAGMREYNGTRIVVVTPDLNNLNPYLGITGNPYIPQMGFVEGLCMGLNGQKYKPNPIRFNTYAQKVEYLDNNQALISRNEITSFFLKNDSVTYHFRKGYKAIDTQNEQNYYLVMYEGKYQLLSYVYSKLLNKEVGIAQTNTGQYFENDQKYYLLTPDGNLAKIQLSKKSLIKALPNEANKIEQWAKVKNIKQFEPETLIELLKLLETDN